MDYQLYQTVLYLAGAINFMIALVLIHNNIWYRYYELYHRSRILVALNFFIFGIGFLMHACFGWRLTWSAAASALTVSYFHSGAILFGWSHISLLRPGYLTRRIVVRDLIILAAGLAAYWTSVVNISLFRLHVAFTIFFVHAAYIALTFYRTYFHVRQNIHQLPSGGYAPTWWTEETKRTVLSAHNSFIIGCNLIILFGLGSIAITAAFPHGLWPYSLLTMLGIAVFCYIFYSVEEYGNVIESATYATERPVNGPSH